MEDLFDIESAHEILAQKRDRRFPQCECGHSAQAHRYKVVNMTDKPKEELRPSDVLLVRKCDLCYCHDFQQKLDD